jgi:hypothetical protein
VSQFAFLESEAHHGEHSDRPRKRLRLSAHDLGLPGDQAELFVHEMSDTGLLLECSLPLEDGEQLDLITPDKGTRQITIVWSCGRYFACNFAELETASRAATAKGMDALPEKGSPEAVSLAQCQLHELSMAIERITGVVDRAINQLSKRER